MRTCLVALIAANSVPREDMGLAVFAVLNGNDAGRDVFVVIMSWFSYPCLELSPSTLVRKISKDL